MSEQRARSRRFDICLLKPSPLRIPVCGVSANPDKGLEAGQLMVVRDGDVPRFTGAKKMSLHQTGFQEVLSAADLLGRYPLRLALIGVQPQDLEDWGGPLTEPVRAALEPALTAAREVLTEWGALPSARRESRAAAEKRHRRQSL